MCLDPAETPTTALRHIPYRRLGAGTSVRHRRSAPAKPVKILLSPVQNFVRIIIRRPQAYSFRSKHRGVPIPGITFLDPDDKVLSTFSFPSKDAAESLVAKMKGAKNRADER